MRANYKLQRLYVRDSLRDGENLTLDAQASHYISHVLRMALGQSILIFNGVDGEWMAKITKIEKKAVQVSLIDCVRAQTRKPDIVYCFAPLKQARFDYMVQKGVEMGAGYFQPVITQHTQISRINLARMQANIIEASEQCGILSLPQCLPPLSLDKLLAQWDESRILLFCDESCQSPNPLALLQSLSQRKVGLLIGPEGGFSQQERERLLAQNYVKAIGLGPRILRADTAAVAALALVGAATGAWED